MRLLPGAAPSLYPRTSCRFLTKIRSVALGGATPHQRSLRRVSMVCPGAQRFALLGL